MRAYPNPTSREEALYQLCEFRANILINHAIDGFDIDYNKAMELLKAVDDDMLLLEDKEKRDRLVAAVDNLIDFAVCEEYQLYKQLPDVHPEINLEVDYIDEENDEFMEGYLDLNEKFNVLYANIENEDTEYAMAMASWWVALGRNVYLTYMTQNDDRVRPWHYALQGFTARRDDFPAWMIPPIEWACRCYLVADDEAYAGLDLKNIVAKTTVEKPKDISGVFKESVCKCGRIFSDEHPYFNVDESDKNMLQGFVDKIKMIYYGKK